MIQQYLHEIQFDRPWVFALLLVWPVWLYTSWRRQRRQIPAVLHPATAHLYHMHTWRLRGLFIPLVLRGVAMLALVAALAQPARYRPLEITTGDGIDIMLCLDVSGSMLARDFEPDRLRAAVEVARQFVTQRKGDRMGLVIFAGQSLTLCPLTTDKNALQQQLNNVNYGQLADGTAIGSGLASAVGKLRASGSPSRVVILLTDGEDTGGFIDPKTALQIAVSYGVKVYTIGIGSTGFAAMPYRTTSGLQLKKEKVNIDETLLMQIANATGGRYFRATDATSLSNVYADIDQLEKSKIETRIFTKRYEALFPFVIAAVVLLLLEVLLTTTVFRKIP